MQAMAAVSEHDVELLFRKKREPDWSSQNGYVFPIKSFLCASYRYYKGFQVIHWRTAHAITWLRRFRYFAVVW